MQRARGRTIRLGWLAGALAISIACLAGAAIAVAQDREAAEREESAAESRGTSFQAVEGPSAEQVPGGPLLVAAYGTVLTLLFGYVAWLARLQATTSRDLARLRSALEKRGETASAAPEEPA